VASTVVVGSTTWGTTLSLLLAKKGIQVTLLTRNKTECDALAASRENSRFLPGIRFPDSLDVSCSPSQALSKADVIIIAVPSSSLRKNVQLLKESIPTDAIVLSATKGLEHDTGKRMSEVLAEELPGGTSDRIAVLSGPNLALEIVEGKPASTVVASIDSAAAQRVQELLMSSTFRVYTNDDVIGVELGGALKNIIAIGVGIAEGLCYGDSGKAALITRGLAEITRLGVAAGANPLTFAGLAGLGDLVATCASKLSRNRYVGEQLALGLPLKEVLASMKNVAEGVPTTVAALKRARQLGVEMPITQATYQVLFEGLDPRQAVAELMGRPPRPEQH
jgi:glycerol-3-phosphate dehydrogenase (NAD(P)+)